MSLSETQGNCTSCPLWSLLALTLSDSATQTTSRYWTEKVALMWRRREGATGSWSYMQSAELRQVGFHMHLAWYRKFCRFGTSLSSDTNHRLSVSATKDNVISCHHFSNKVDVHSGRWKCNLSKCYGTNGHLAVFTFCHGFWRQLCVKYVQISHTSSKRKNAVFCLFAVFLLIIVIITSGAMVLLM